MSDYDSIEDLQAQGIIDSKRIATIKICLVMFLHSCILAVLMSQVFAIWLDKQVHLDALQIGEIMGMKGFVAIFYKPLFGWILDKTQLRIKFILTLAIAGLASGPFFQFVYKPLLMHGGHAGFFAAGILGGIYFGYVVIAGGAAMFSYCARYILAHGGTEDKIGTANMAAWLGMGFVLTILYTFNPTWGFYLASFAALLLIFVMFSLKVKIFDTLNTKSTSRQKITLPDLKKLIMNPRFYVLAFFASVIMVSVYAQYSQVGRVGLSFWPSSMQTYGLRLVATINVPFSIFACLLLVRCSSLIKKISPSKALILLTCCYAFALLLFGLAELLRNTTTVLDAKGFPTTDHYIPSLIAGIGAGQVLGLVNPFTNVVVLSYVGASFNQKMAGTAFLVGFNFLTNLFGSAGAAVVGGMFKFQGWQNAYIELSIFIFFCAIILALLIKFANSRDKVRVLEHLKNKADA